MATKIATCCYCASRTVLQLTARDGHELACGSCGAPLHEMKAVKAEGKKPKREEAQARHRPVEASQSRKTKKKQKKKRKSFWNKAFEEAFDFVEDIFD